MSMDIFCFGVVLGFLMKLLNSPHPPGYLGMLLPSPTSTTAAFTVYSGASRWTIWNHLSRSEYRDHAEEQKKSIIFSQLRECKARSRIIDVIPTQVIRTNHEANNDHDKPMKRRLSRETGRNWYNMESINFSIMWSIARKLGILVM